MVDDNATQSALRSGYGPGYGSAQVTGSRLLSDAMCQARIAYLRAERAKRLGLDADRIIQHAAAIAFSDIGDVLEHTRRLDEEGNAVPEPRPQVACTNCQGRGWFNGPAPDHGHRECGHCGGTGKVADERWEPTNAQVARGLWPLRNWEDIPPHARIAIQEFTDTESANGTKRRGVKFHPKQPALQMLAQIAKLLVARMSVENPDGTNLIPPIPATQEGQERALAEIIARGLGRAPG